MFPARSPGSARETIRQHDDHSRIRTQIQALDDQAWAALTEFLPDIERIKAHETITPRDRDILQMVLATVIGSIRFRRAEVARGDKT